MTVPCTAVIVGFVLKVVEPIFPSVKISSGWQTAISQSSKGAKILISSLVGVRLGNLVTLSPVFAICFVFTEKGRLLTALVIYTVSRLSQLVVIVPSTIDLNAL